MGRWSNIGTAVFAFLAAIFWFLSASGKLPPMMSYWDGTPPSDPFYAALKSSAQMNTCAAVLSGLSALCVFAGIIAR